MNGTTNQILLSPTDATSLSPRTSLPKPPKVPCGTCPYRKDVPSGVWGASEYNKLPRYDGDTGTQFVSGGIALFMCHQNDGCLCGGWLVTHDTRHLAALRVHDVDPSAFNYHPDVECFASGAEAAAHGLADVDAPSPQARRKINGLVKLKEGSKT